MTIKEVPIGGMFTTGPGRDVYVKYDEPARYIEIVTGRVFNGVSCRGCKEVKPADLRRAARQLADHQLFHPKDKDESPKPQNNEKRRRGFKRGHRPVRRNED